MSLIQHKEEIKALDLFNQCILHVPSYQRNFDWGVEQCEELWDDIVGLNSGESHFIGLIILCESDSRCGLQRVHEIVDGQQRLTALYIAACAALKTCQGKGDFDPNSENMQNIARVLFSSSSKPRMTHSTDDERYFSSYLEFIKDPQGAPPKRNSKSEDYIWNAHTFFIGKFEAIGSTSTQIFDAMRDLLCGALALTITCADRGVAYRTFMVLNDRGTALSPLQLLRAELTSKAPKKDHDQIAQAFSRLMERDPGDTKVLQWNFSSFTGKRSPRDTIFKTTSRHLSSPPIIDRIRSLESTLSLYLCLSDGGWPFSSARLLAHKESITKTLFVSLDHDACMPILIAAKETLKEKRFLELIECVAKFFFRYRYICNNNITAAQTLYLKHAKLIRENKFQIRRLKSDMGDLLRKKAPDEIFKESLRRNLRYNPDKSLKATNQNNSIIYFFGVLSDPNHSQRSSAARLADTSLEHIVPKGRKPADHTVHNLGNLCVLGCDENSVLGDIIYGPEKRDAYKKSRHGSANAAGKIYASFSESDIATREAQLCEDACSAFSF